MWDKVRNRRPNIRLRDGVVLYSYTNRGKRHEISEPLVSDQVIQQVTQNISQEIAQENVAVGNLDIAASRDFVADDLNKYHEVTAAGGAPVTLNIPAGLGEVGDWIVVRKADDNEHLTISAADTLTGGKVLTLQYDFIQLLKISDNVWRSDL